MPHPNEYILLRNVLPEFAGRALEVGSREYPEAGHTAQRVYQRVLPGAQWVGLDMQAGPNVDVVGDLTTGLCGMEPASFDLVVCASVLEHCAEPKRMAENIEALTKPGGIVYVTVPWVWRFHAYPNDYWRISWAGIHRLFPAVEWRDPLYSTSKPGEFVNVAQNPEADNMMAKVIDGRKYLPYLMTYMVGVKRGDNDVQRA